MQPLGRKPNRHNYEDYHPRDNRVNWWQVEIDNSGNKKAARQKAKFDIDQEIIHRYDCERYYELD